MRLEDVAAEFFDFIEVNLPLLEKNIEDYKEKRYRIKFVYDSTTKNTISTFNTPLSQPTSEESKDFQNKFVIIIPFIRDYLAALEGLRQENLLTFFNADQLKKLEGYKNRVAAIYTPNSPISQDEITLKTKECKREIQYTSIFITYNVGLTFDQSHFEKAFRSAAASGNAVDLAELAKDPIINIDARDSNPASRKTALHWAVIKASSSCIQLLLELGAKTDIRDAKGWTPISYAINNQDITRLFTSKVKDKISSLGM